MSKQQQQIDLLKRAIDFAEQGKEIPADWAKVIFPSEKREYELSYYGKQTAESDPRQCTVNGKTYVQGSTDGGSKTDTGEPHAYVGLSEEDALNKAKSENKPARVVSRNGEELPVTMDFVKGRLNLTVNNGKVEKVEVEGE